MVAYKKYRADVTHAVTKKTAKELKLQQSMDNFKTKPDAFELEKSLIYI